MPRADRVEEGHSPPAIVESVAVEPMAAERAEESPAPAPAPAQAAAAAAASPGSADSSTRSSSASGSAPKRKRDNRSAAMKRTGWGTTRRRKKKKPKKQKHKRSSAARQQQPQPQPTAAAAAPDQDQTLDWALRASQGDDDEDDELEREEQRTDGEADARPGSRKRRAAAAPEEPELEYASPLLPATGASGSDPILPPPLVCNAECDKLRRMAAIMQQGSPRSPRDGDGAVAAAAETAVPEPSSSAAAGAEPPPEDSPPPPSSPSKRKAKKRQRPDFIDPTSPGVSFAHARPKADPAKWPRDFLTSVQRKKMWRTGGVAKVRQLLPLTEEGYAKIDRSRVFDYQQTIRRFRERQDPRPIPQGYSETPQFMKTHRFGQFYKPPKRARPTHRLPAAAPAPRAASEGQSPARLPAASASSAAASGGLPGQSTAATAAAAVAAVEVVPSSQPGQDGEGAVDVTPTQRFEEPEQEEEQEQQEQQQQEEQEESEEDGGTIKPFIDSDNPTVLTDSLRKHSCKENDTVTLVVKKLRKGGMKEITVQSVHELNRSRRYGDTLKQTSRLKAGQTLLIPDPASSLRTTVTEYVGWERLDSWDGEGGRGIIFESDDESEVRSNSF